MNMELFKIDERDHVKYWTMNLNNEKKLQFDYKRRFWEKQKFFPKAFNETCLLKFTDDIFIRDKSFSEKYVLGVKTEIVIKYINKYYNQIDDNYYFHALNVGILRGVYFINLGEEMKVYVGETLDQTFQKRWDQHINKLTNGTHENWRMQKAFDKTKSFTPMIYSMYRPDSNEAVKTISITEDRYITLLWENNYNIRKY